MYCDHVRRSAAEESGWRVFNNGRIQDLETWILVTKEVGLSVLCHTWNSRNAISQCLPPILYFDGYLAEVLNMFRTIDKR